MKNNILFSIVLMMLTVCLIGQNNVTLNINHKLSDANFEMNLPTKNNINHNFYVTRLEYYISEISIIHDSGIETVIDDLWILVNADQATNVDLGSYTINNVEMLKMHIGVNPEVNHNDPSAYDSDHPLAPKFPSMHWGWNPGYRFVAIEGMSGSALNQVFQLHGLGDNNYFTTEIEMLVPSENNQITINLDADYTRSLENIELDAGLIVHGDDKQSKTCLQNFKDFVFTHSDATSSNIEFGDVKSFEVFPNPSINGPVTLNFETINSSQNYNLSITDMNGRLIQLYNSIGKNHQIDLQTFEPGMYFFNLLKNGQVIKSKKLVKVN